MGGKMARNKGSRFELEIAKALTNVSGHPWRRTPLSGGWSKEVPQGDLICTDANCLLVFELKNQECWSFDSLMSGNTTVFDHWWEQCVESAEGKIPVVVFTKNRYETFAMVDNDNDALLDCTRDDMPRIIYGINYSKFTIIQFKDFILTIDWPKVFNGNRN